MLDDEVEPALGDVSGFGSPKSCRWSSCRTSANHCSRRPCRRSWAPRSWSLPQPWELLRAWLVSLRRRSWELPQSWSLPRPWALLRLCRFGLGGFVSLRRLGLGSFLSLGHFLGLGVLRLCRFGIGGFVSLRRLGLGSFLSLGHFLGLGASSDFVASALAVSSVFAVSVLGASSALVTSSVLGPQTSSLQTWRLRQSWPRLRSSQPPERRRRALGVLGLGRFGLGRLGRFSRSSSSRSWPLPRSWVLPQAWCVFSLGRLGLASSSVLAVLGLVASSVLVASDLVASVLASGLATSSDLPSRLGRFLGLGRFRLGVSRSWHFGAWRSLPSSCCCRSTAEDSDLHRHSRHSSCRNDRTCTSCSPG